ASLCISVLKFHSHLQNKKCVQPKPYAQKTQRSAVAKQIEYTISKDMIVSKTEPAFFYYKKYKHVFNSGLIYSIRLATLFYHNTNGIARKRGEHSSPLRESKNFCYRFIYTIIVGAICNRLVT
ncbi:MAG: hypothetical protein ACI4IN_06055, partial [Eubacterium sp.]